MCLRMAVNLLWKRIENSEYVRALIPSLYCFSHSQGVGPLLRLLFFFSIYILYSCFMYVSFIHVSIYAFTHMHTHIYYVHKCVYTSMHIYTQACIHIYLHTQICTHIHIHSVYMYNCNPYKCVCTHTNPQNVVYPNTLHGWNHFGCPLLLH